MYCRGAESAEITSDSYGGWLERSSQTITSLLKPSSIAGVRERFYYGINC